MEQKILPSSGEVKYADALAMAIEREIKAKFMYKTIAKYSKVPHLKTKVEFLAEEEQSHRENLEDLYKKIGGETQDFDAQVHFPDESKVKGLAEMKVDELLKVAIQKEKEAHAFYITMASNSKDEGMKDLFNYLAEEESTHRRILELELKLYEGEKPLSRPVEAIPGIYRDWW